MTAVAVPAQITTVEDKVFAGLTPLQLTLMAIPLCIGFLAYAALPPNFHMVVYKLAGVIFLELIGLIASLRIKDEVLLRLVVTRLHYNLRPRYYVYDKNDSYLRNIPQAVTLTPLTEVSGSTKTVKTDTARPKLDMAQVVKMEDIMADPRAKMRFVMGKEGTNVIIREIK